MLLISFASKHKYFTAVAVAVTVVVVVVVVAWFPWVWQKLLASDDESSMFVIIDFQAFTIRGFSGGDGGGG